MTGTRPDPPSGFDLPTEWEVGGEAWARQTGSPGRGLSPDGGPAVFDISLARAEDGSAALVFHLQD